MAGAERPSEIPRMSASSTDTPARQVDIHKLTTAVEEQTAVLRRIDQRQAAADISQQPMPEVPATSSGAWNALLRSALTGTIQPKIDRWRSGLDALLVFLGLFSGIVTSFFVASLNTLKTDGTARTNELLANLTDIIIALSAVTEDELRTRIDVQRPAVFHPDESDVRLNSYWALSLVLSLSLAALAVLCRGFLNMATSSRHPKASNKLVDIISRWSATEQILGTAIEALPPLLVVPVLLFIVGLLDTLISSVLQISPPPAPILVISGILLLFVFALVAFLIFAIADGGLNPTKSPFQTTLGHAFYSRLYPALSSGISMLRSKMTPSTSRSRAVPPTEVEPYALSTNAKIYHEVMQATHDDDALDQASAALFEVIQLSVYPKSGHPPRAGPLADEEHATLLHLLSPEATIRSTRTAAQVIIRAHSENFDAISLSSAQIDELVPALADAAKRSCIGNSLSVLWESPFLLAMAIVVDPDLALKDNPPAVWILASAYSAWDHLPSTADDRQYIVPTHKIVILFVWKVVVSKLTEALSDSTRATESGIVDGILSPQWGEPLHLRHLLAALLYIPSRDDLTLIVMWLARTQALPSIISAALDNVEAITTDQLMHLGKLESQMFPSLFATIGQVCLSVDDFTDHELLLKLCIFTFFKSIPGIRGQALVRGVHDLVETILTIVHGMPLPPHGSVLLNDLVRIREVVAMLSLAPAHGSADSLPVSTYLAPQVLNGRAPTAPSLSSEIDSLLAQFEFIYAHAMRSA